MSTDYEEWVASLTIVGDEAFAPGERVVVARPSRDIDNARHRERWATDPEYRARRLAYFREYRARNRDYFRAYQRAWYLRRSA